MTSEPVAAIDVGTNSAKLLVARSNGAELEVIEDRANTPRLGEGLAGNGAISDQAARRGLAAIEELLAVARELGVAPARTRAVGTAVFRRASNARAFVDRVRTELGATIEVLSEAEEARLGYAAVRAGGAAAETLIVDVGGGSSEVVSDGGRERRSIPVGAVVLTERWIGLGGRAPLEDGPAPSWEALRQDVERASRALPAGVAAHAEVVVLGGSGSNLGCLHMGLERFDPLRPEGLSIPTGAADHWARILAPLSPEERLRWPLEASRAEILPAGLFCLAGVLERLGARQVRLSGRGLRYGLARELLAGDCHARG